MNTSQQETLFDTPGPDQAPLETRTSLDRLEMVYGELGFIPHSMPELNDATLALDHRDLSGGFARRLNEVLQHQKKAETNDATAALRSILSRTKGYASQTRADKTSLNGIAEELQDYVGIQNFLDLSDVPNLSGWSLQPITARGLGLMNRHMVVEKAIADHEMPTLDLLATEEAVADMMVSTRVYEADAAIKAGLQEASRRHEFWISCLQEATNHTVVRPIAFQALRSLGVIEHE